jgi:sugar transferase (PEP-CTERM/EpsH1 system associated)
VKDVSRPTRVNAQADASSSAGANVAVPLVVHIIYRLDVGGMENGLVNLINHMPAERYRHAIVCLDQYTDFRLRLRRSDVACYALHKRPGKDLALYLRLWRLLRRLRPEIVHTRNLAALDSLVPAAFAGARYRVHGEHGRDVIDIDGNSRKYTLLRRALRPFAHRYIALSLDLEGWLRERIGITPEKLVHICNGVDMGWFQPTGGIRAPLPVAGFAGPETFVIGSVLRLEPVKDPMNLVRAFVHLLSRWPRLRERARLVLVGNGPLYTEAERELEHAGVRRLAWLPGTRNDVAQLLRGFDAFALPSLAEGISNTILEAMASGLPVVATNVGGNSELVLDGETGLLVPRSDPEALAHALRRYIGDPELAARHGRAGRERVEREFSLEAMMRRYLAVYDDLLGVLPPGSVA